MVWNFSSKLAGVTEGPLGFSGGVDSFKGEQGRVSFRGFSFKSEFVSFLRFP